MKKVLISLCFLVLCSVSFAGPKEDLVGYYKVNVEWLKESVKKKMDRSTSMTKADADAMLERGGSMVVQFTEQEMRGWVIGRPTEVLAYTIEKIDGNTLSVKANGATNDIIVTKESIEFVSGSAMKYVKISETEAKEMIAKVEAENKKKETPPAEKEAPIDGSGME